VKKILCFSENFALILSCKKFVPLSILRCQATFQKEENLTQGIKLIFAQKMREAFQMFLTIPAKIEDGCIIPIAEMPASELIRRVVLLVEVEDVQTPTDDFVLPRYKRQSVLSSVDRLRGILKEDSDSDYVTYLENKYQ